MATHVCRSAKANRTRWTTHRPTEVESAGSLHSRRRVGLGMLRSTKTAAPELRELVTRVVQRNRSHVLGCLINNRCFGVWATNVGSVPILRLYAFFIRAPGQRPQYISATQASPLNLWRARQARARTRAQPLCRVMVGRNGAFKNHLDNTMNTSMVGPKKNRGLAFSHVFWRVLYVVSKPP